MQYNSLQDISSFVTDLKSFIKQTEAEESTAETVEEKIEEEEKEITSISSIRQQINKERLDAAVEQKERKTMYVQCHKKKL